MTAIPLKKTFGDSFRQASVVAIDLGEKIARLDDGTEVRFTHLVLATGSEGDYPARTESKYVYGAIYHFRGMSGVYTAYWLFFLSAGLWRSWRLRTALWPPT